MKIAATESSHIKLSATKRSLWKDIVKHKYFYIMILPVVVFYIVFSYVPMYGITLAFKTFDYSKGIMGSPWNNFENFREVLSNPDFVNAFINTLFISAGRLLIEFPIPIILALLLNEISKSKLKKIYQTVFTFPHFLSWVILSGIIVNILGDKGMLNQILVSLGFAKNTILTNNTSFLGLVFSSNIWKEAGWSSIIYLAAIAGINPELYEAATVDGANRFQKMKAVTWPTVRSTAVVLLVLAIGNIMNGGFDQIFNLYNPTVYKRADILDTFVYRSAFVDATGFGFSTAVGFMKSILNFALLLGANFIAKSIGEEGGI